MELKLEEDDVKSMQIIRDNLPKSVVAAKRPILRNNANSVLIRSEFNL
jgi:hypothetical protein